MQVIWKVSISWCSLIVSDRSISCVIIPEADCRPSTTRTTSAHCLGRETSLCFLMNASSINEVDAPESSIVKVLIFLLIKALNARVRSFPRSNTCIIGAGGWVFKFLGDIIGLNEGNSVVRATQQWELATGLGECRLYPSTASFLSHTELNLD